MLKSYNCIITIALRLLLAFSLYPWFAFGQASATLTAASEIWCDDFESYPLGSFPSPPWCCTGNCGGAYIDDSVSFSGSQSLHLYGIVGGCWAALAYRPLNTPPPYTIEFMVYNGTEATYGCHPTRGELCLRASCDWTDPRIRGLVRFENDGRIGLYDSVGWDYNEEQWVRVRVDYARPTDTTVHLAFWINDELLYAVDVPAFPYEDDLIYVEIIAQEGTVWFDDVCVMPLAAGPPTVSLDIKPGSCPNPLNVKAPKTHDNPMALKSGPDDPPKPKPVLPVAILGTADLDVTDIDPATVTLEGVPALRWNTEDVSTPVGEDAEECECNSLGADGYPDLTLKFGKGLIVEALGEVHDGDVVALTITGELSNGTAFEGTDCVVIRGDSQPADGFSPPEEEPPTAVLLGNYPNPFNPTTEISFSLPNASDVKLEVYNVMGQQVATIMDGFMEAGTHSVTFGSRDGSGRLLSSGIYFYRLEAGEFVETKKMVLLK